MTGTFPSPGGRMSAYADGPGEGIERATSTRRREPRNFGRRIPPRACALYDVRLIDATQKGTDMPLDMLTIELKMLVWSVALCFVQVIAAASSASHQVGAMVLAGNRANVPPLTGLAQRAQRAHLNMIENLLLVAILVLVATLSLRTNDLTALGAQMFFWARVGFAIVYLIGIPFLRTGIWLVGVAGMAIIFYAIVTWPN